MSIKIKYIKNGKELEAEIPEADFKHFEEKYEAKKVGGSKPAKAEAKKEEPKKKSK
jgi:hypothetical protein